MLVKEAKNLFFFYIGVFYLFPLVIGLFIPATFTALYRGFDSSIGFAFIFLFLFLVFIFDKVTPKGFSFISFRWIGNLFENKWFNLTLSGIFLILSIRFTLKYGITFRQSGEATLVQTGFEVILLFAIKAYATACLFYFILKAFNDLPIYIWQRIVMAIFGIALILIIVASLDMLYILGCLIIAFKKEKLLFASLEKSKTGVFRNIMKSALLIVLILSIIFVGYADKFGTQEASVLFAKRENTQGIIEHVTPRVGIWYASVMANGNHDIFDNSMSLKTLAGMTNNLYSRIKVLTGAKQNAEARRPDSWSTARTNYLNTYKVNDNAKTGATPGLIASSFYLPFFPVNFIIIASYALFILRKFSRSMFGSKKSFNFLGRFMLLFFFATSLFADPVGYLNFIDPSFIYFILFLGATDKIYFTNNYRFRKQLSIKLASINNPYAA